MLSRVRDSWQRQSKQGRAALIGCAVLVLVCIVAGAVYVMDQDGIDIVDATDSTRTYVTVFLLVALDAVVPIFPGETTLNTASTGAAQGTLELGPIIVMGALGAIVGDSVLFWISRRSSARIEPQLRKARENKLVQQSLATMEASAPVLIIGGRYIPGMRFVVTATMGLSDMRYRRFLPWSIVGGTLWSAYTCVLAYTVATALSGFPFAAVLISGFVTTAILTTIFLIIRHHHRNRVEDTEGNESKTEAPA